MNTSTANTDNTAKTETPPVAPANGHAVPGNTPPPPSNGGNPTPGAEDSSEHLLLRLQQARESLGAALDVLGEVKGAVRGIVRQHRALEREHEGLKRSLRAIQKMEV